MIERENSAFPADKQTTQTQTRTHVRVANNAGANRWITPVVHACPHNALLHKMNARIFKFANRQKRKHLHSHSSSQVLVAVYWFKSTWHFSYRVRNRFHQISDGTLKTTHTHTVVACECTLHKTVMFGFQFHEARVVFCSIRFYCWRRQQSILDDPNFSLTRHLTCEAHWDDSVHSFEAI